MRPSAAPRDDGRRRRRRGIAPVVGRCNLDPTFESALQSNLKPESVYIAFDLNLTLELAPNAVPKGGALAGIQKGEKSTFGSV